LITRRDEPVRLSPQGLRSPDLQPVPGGRKLGCGSSPRSKRMTSTLRPRVLLLLEAVSDVAMPAPRCGEPWTPGPKPTWPRPGLFVDSQLIVYPVLDCQRLLAPAISGCALDSAPKRRRRRLAGIQKKFELLTIGVDALRAWSKNPCTKGHPVRLAGVAFPRTVANVGGRCISRRRGDRWVSGGERPVASHQVRSIEAVGSGFLPTRSAGVAWTA